MDPPSFADIRKKFNDGRIPIKKVPAPKPPPTIVNNETSIDSSIPSRSERSASNTLNQLSDDANTTGSDPATTAAQASNETSSSREAILDRLIPQGAKSYTGLKKAPAPLPDTVNRERNGSISSETSPSASQTLMSSPTIPPHAINYTSFHKAPVPLPNSANREQKRSIQSDSTDVIQDNISSAVIPQNIAGHSYVKKPPVPLPDSDGRDIDERNNSESSSIIPQSTPNYPGFKKRPAPLPNSVTRDRNENIHSQPSPSPSTLHRVFPASPNNFTDLKRPSTPPRNAIESDENESIESRYASLSHATMSHLSVSPKANKKSDTLLSDPVNENQYEICHSESLSISLETVLPSKCMFSEFEELIDDYRRKDPRSIIYPKTKATMPKITTNELHILQRYSNT